jgi:hypothetical protein
MGQLKVLVVVAGNDNLLFRVFLVQLLGNGYETIELGASHACNRMGHLAFKFAIWIEQSSRSAVFLLARNSVQTNNQRSPVSPDIRVPG